MPLLSLQHVSIQFPGVKALSDISLDLHEGEIHALVGENGAGKSTLIKIIGGVWTCDNYEGKLLIDDNEVRFHSVRDSEKYKIQIIHQELSLVNQMTVAENIFLGSEPMHFGFVDYTTMRVRAHQVLQKLNTAISPDALVSTLTIGEQQLVEIAKALSKEARLLVLDEPTAALPEKDVQNLIRLLFDLKAKGLGIIYISHKLNEVLEISDTITVLRNGERISQFKRDTVDPDIMVRDMIGRSLDTVFPEIQPCSTEKIVRLENITLPHPGIQGKNIVEKISFSVHKGEVLGIAGLLGSGRTALLSLLFGAFRGNHEGRIFFNDMPYSPSSPADALRKGIALVSEDRKKYGLLKTGDIADNMTISSLDQFLSMGMLDFAQMTAACQNYVHKLNIKTPSLETPIVNLSGGNQQKVILGRFLMSKPQVLLLDDPTRGIDVGAKVEIYKLVHTLAQQGMGIIFVSSELPEVLGVSHRVLVLQDGRVRSEFKHGHKSEEEVLALAAGI